MIPAHIPGLELSRLFFGEVVEPVLTSALDGVPYSAALIGSGSEVQGFDTARSTDHDWGPRMQVFLGVQAFDARAGELTALLDRVLPPEFRGYPIRYALSSEPVALARHHVTVHGLREYFEEFLGEDPTSPLSVNAWLTTPTQVLRELTAGAVFHDGLGTLELARGNLAWYPDDLWRYVLACQWARLGQEEHFVGRCGEVGDDLGSAVIPARLVRDLMKLCLLMARVYPPYSKWLGTAFAALPCADSLVPSLSAAVAARSWQEREGHLSVAYEAVAVLHNALGLTEPLDATVRQFWDRPFLVPDSNRFHAALIASMTDPNLRELPPVGAIDQYVDSTELNDRGGLGRRRRYVPGSMG